MNNTKQKKTKIIIDIERMKYPFTGLYFYCKDLALNLEKYHAHQFDFYFFSYPGVVLPSHLKLIIRRFFDKYFLLKPKKYKLWHSTWQDTRLVPRNDTKFVYTIHDLNFLYTDKTKHKKKELLYAIQKKIDRADAITVISNFVKSDIEKHLDTKGKEIHVIYNGVELDIFPNFKKPKYKPANKFFFTVGTVLYKKHFHVLPRILVGNDYELVIAGIHSNKNYINQIISEAKKYGVESRVKLIGTISDEEKYWFLNNTEAFLFPSISEGFGLPPIEAMRMGKPTFLSTHTSLPEIGGKHAYYFNSFEPEAMRKVLKDGLADYHKNNRQPAIIEWSKQFNWKTASAAYVRVYQKVLKIKNSINQSNTKTKVPITAIIPTLNESKNIETAIQSVAFADEIIIIDSYSTDNTIALAKKYNVRILQRKFDDFSSQKNYAISKASHDWVFVLDADERLSDELKNEIIATTHETNTKDAYWIFRQNFFADKKIRFSGWQNDKVMRLFNRKLCKYEGLVHEEIINNGTTGYLSGKMLHYSCKDKFDFKNKITKYAILKAKELYAIRSKPSAFHLYIKPAYRFFYHYFFKLGFLDGKHGLTIAKVNAYGMKKRYEELKKLYEAEKKQQLL